ncbi:hypothetical protein [Bacillus alkalicellulosilyticus]|uniref:hypothetical protein n=1 Tax=Alkalihalobacterium alkalicellulosilyticum TaxID=1912214 RepID=UPI00099728F7|nr:hypothetical protein [Bacillus alkalicellulosilyticus]
MKRKVVILITLILLMLSACSDVETKKEIAVDDVNTEIEENLGYDIEKALGKIIGTPSASSNPSDYIKDNQEEFDYIVGQGTKALNYMMNKFSTSNSDGLIEYVMALACIEILGDIDPVKEWDTGRDWYNSYRNL